MRKLSSALIIIFVASMLNVSAFAVDKPSLLRQKMEAKGRTAGSAKLIAQYQTKFKQLLGQIQYQYTVLDGVLKQSQNLTDEDRSSLMDILENDPDYSLSNVQDTYNNMMSKLPKNDVKALMSTLQSQYKAFSSILNNLNEFASDLPQYYIYGDNSQVSDGDDQNNNSNDNSQEINNNETEKNNTAVENKTDEGTDNTINIKIQKPMTLEQMQYILSKIKPGDSVMINGQRINYDKIKAEVQKMLSRSQLGTNTEGNTTQTTTDSAIQN